MQRYNMKLVILLCYIIFTFSLLSCSDKSTNTQTPYTPESDSIRIGTQVWMTTNLNLDRYANGRAIPNIIDKNAWHGLSTGACCDYEDIIGNSAVYGKLYNYYAVIDGNGLAPKGWRIPNDKDWQILSDYLEGDYVSGGKLKEAGSTHWQTPNTGATNEVGFFALPGGYRTYYGYYGNIGLVGCWWSSSGKVRQIDYATAKFSNIITFQGNGVSVRCIKE